MTVDFSQGAIAALVPLLVLERGYSYAAAAGIVLAFSLVSSIVQPVFGALGDRWTMRWLIPVSVLLAGAGIAAVGVFDSFWITALVAAVSGDRRRGVPSGRRQPGAGDQQRRPRDDVVVLPGREPRLRPRAPGRRSHHRRARAGASPLLMIPALTGVLAVAMIGRVHASSASPGKKAKVAAGRDDWGAFSRMPVAIICRSIVFVGMGSFIVLFMRQDCGVSDTLASASLFVFYIGGAFGTAIGGYLARRWPRTTIRRWSYLLAVPVVAGMLLIPGPFAWVFIALASVVLYVPFSLHITLGQDYLRVAWVPPAASPSALRCQWAGWRLRRSARWPTASAWRTRCFRSSRCLRSRSSCCSG